MEWHNKGLKILQVSIVIISVIGYGLVAFSVAPTGGYFPGETLDPDCAPDETDCLVNIGPRIGDPIHDGTADEILYVDDSGNLISDNGFTRDSTTGEFHVSAEVTSGEIAEFIVGSDIQFVFDNGTESYTFPRVDGSVDQVLATDGSGIIAWTTPIIGQTNEAGTETWLGEGTGEGSIDSADHTLFLGSFSGSYATSASYANFIGMNAGVGSENFSFSNAIGYGAGSSLDMEFSNFIGYNAGISAHNASQSNFIGYEVGYGSGQAGGVSTSSSFIGSYAGEGGSNVDYSNVFGQQAGRYAHSISNSNFVGSLAGGHSSSILGTNVSDSNFIGSSAGFNATDITFTNFIGYQAGLGISGLASANFIGKWAGYEADNASNSIFIGESAGRVGSNGSANAANSIFIGTEAGYQSGDSGLNNTGNANDYSILLGNYSSTGGFENSIALGQRAVNTASNQFMIGSTTRPIDQIVMVTTGGATCAVDINGTSCPSDERLKKNITDLPTNILDTLVDVRTVTFNWKRGTDNETRLGFIAQDIQQYFPELITEGDAGYMSVNYAGITPVLVEAIRELNIKLEKVEEVAEAFANEETLFEKLIAWFADAENGIDELFAKKGRFAETICVDDECLTKDDIRALLQLTQSQDENNDDSDDNQDENNDNDNSDTTDDDSENDGSEDENGDDAQDEVVTDPGEEDSEENDTSEETVIEEETTTEEDISNEEQESSDTDDSENDSEVEESQSQDSEEGDTSNEGNVVP